jgi:hypothetical protein
MIGEIFDEHTRQDIVDAQALGLDAFALNISTLFFSTRNFIVYLENTSRPSRHPIRSLRYVKANNKMDCLQSWATNTVERLFNNADELGFGLFFSFDMAAGTFNKPSDYASYLTKYTSRSSYFTYKSKPLVTTFGGESVTNDAWSSFKSTVGDINLIPGFYAAKPSSDFFSSRSALDGVFNWNSWSYPDAGQVEVSITDDKTFMKAASNAGKSFIMGMSPLQFKHMGSSTNWYRRGESNLEIRIEQVLAMQPDMIELQTWNDAGESHYMGNLWNEPMTGSSIHDYVDGYNHTGYWQVLPAFIEAWKRGDTDTSNMVPTNDKPVQGAFWHHTLTVDADCSADRLGKPSGVKNAEDVVTGIVLVAEGNEGLVAVVNNGGVELNKTTLSVGYNRFKFPGLGKGKVQLEVWDGSTMVGGGYAGLEVVERADVCNYNFQVVGFPG